MPFNRSAYPANWPAISAAIRARAQGQCECTGECGLHHGRRCTEQHGERARWANGRVILTVAHLDHDTGDDPARMKAMCQRCHLRYDHAQHMASARATAKARRMQLEMAFGLPAASGAGQEA